MTHRAVDVLHTATGATDQMMMVVADPRLKTRRTTRRLDPPNQTRRRQGA